MFASHEIALDARYEVAGARLAHVADWGVLHGMSETAYEGGLEMLIRVGPLGGAPGLSKLVRVRVLDPVRRSGTMTVSLRWEATGLAGELFPVLDADLTLRRESDDQSRLSLVGSYRPPLGRPGVVLDKTIMSRVAAATIRSLLDRLAAALADPAPDSPVERDSALRSRPVNEPDQSWPYRPNVRRQVRSRQNVPAGCSPDV